MRRKVFIFDHLNCANLMTTNALKGILNPNFRPFSFELNKI